MTSDEAQELPPEIEQIFQQLDSRLSGYDYIRYGLKRIGDACYEKALESVEYYHSSREDEHAIKPIKDRGFLMCRVTKNRGKATNGISIEWFEQKPIPKQHQVKGKSRVLSKRIPKGQGITYPRRSVLTKSRKPYEIDLFDHVEPQFAPIRHLSLLLSKVERAIRDMRAAHDKLKESEEEEERL